LLGRDVEAHVPGEPARERIAAHAEARADVRHRAEHRDAIRIGHVGEIAGGGGIGDVLDRRLEQGQFEFELAEAGPVVAGCGARRFVQRIRLVDREQRSTGRLGRRSRGDCGRGRLLSLRGRRVRLHAELAREVGGLDFEPREPPGETADAVDQRAAFGALEVDEQRRARRAGDDLLLAHPVADERAEAHGGQTAGEGARGQRPRTQRPHP